MTHIKGGGEGRGWPFKVTFLSPPTRVWKGPSEKKESYLHKCEKPQVKKGFFNNLHNSKSSRWKNNFLPPQVLKSPRWKKGFYPPPNNSKSSIWKNDSYLHECEKPQVRKTVFHPPISVKSPQVKMVFYYPHKCEKAQVGKRKRVFKIPSIVWKGL